MAATGKKRYKETGRLLLSYVLLLTLVPYCVNAVIFRPDIKLTIPDNIDPGSTILSGDIIVEECVELFHVQKSPSTAFKPLILQKDGAVITNSSLTEFSGDLFVFHPKVTEFCQSRIPVSLNAPIQVEIVPSQNTLSFVQSYYRGFVPARFSRDTRVEGINDLYACHSTCRNNIEYKIVGTDDFYLQTVSDNDHVQLSIFVKDAVAVSNNAVYNFIVTAENAEGILGHTSVHIDIKGGADGNLYFLPEQNAPIMLSRHRRQLVQEDLPDQTVQENSNGLLFSIANSTTRPSYTYQLISSSYAGAFIVSLSGDVQVAAGFTLDYEALTDKTVVVIFHGLQSNTGSCNLKLESIFGYI